jgi:hypothetical protein
MRGWLVVCVLAAGCASEDLCSDPQFKGRACFTVELSGSIDQTPFDSARTLDEVQVDSTYFTDARGAELIARTSAAINRAAMPSGGVHLPVSFFVAYPGSAIDNLDIKEDAQLIFVVRSHGTPLGIVVLKQQVSFRTIEGTIADTADQHGHFSLSLSPASQSSCFNHVRDGMESDVDCGGGDCPACDHGQRCSTGTPDCLSPSSCGGGICD